MSNSPAPTNYEWKSNTLIFELDSGVTGVRIKYLKDGESNWIVILDSPDIAINNCNLDAIIYGPTGTVCGVTKKSSSSSEGWGTETCYPITNE